MKKIIYVRSTNIYDDSRATKEIGALLDQKYDVLVLGWNRDGRALEKSREQFCDYTNISFAFFQKEINGGIGIKNIGVLLAWFVWVKKRIKKENNVDAIHACNLDSAIMLTSYSKLHNIKLIYDIYDYYIDSHSIPSVVRNFVEKKEIKVINNADLTIICTEERREQIEKAKPKDLLVIHNSPNVEKTEEVREEYDYVYCGALIKGRMINEIFTEYKNNANLLFCVAGYGELSLMAEKMDAEYENFHYFGALPYNDVLFKEKQSKIISAIYEPNRRNHRLCAPNKFYEALALAKPIIVCKGTGIDKIVEKNRIGVVIDYNEKEFYKAIRYLKDNDSLRKQMGMRARELYDKEYRWNIMKDKLLKKYEELVGC